MLEPVYAKTFERDIKRLKRRHIDFTELRNVIRLVLEDTVESKNITAAAPRPPAQRLGLGRCD